MPMKSSYEKWVWTELLGFDADQKDGGVASYLKTLGFIPKGISLLIGAPDVILQHEGLDKDAVLPRDFCARDGHAGNEDRPTQAWTRFQVRSLVGELQRAGCKVYLSIFTHYLNDEFHEEWLSSHPEGKVTWAHSGRKDGLCVLARQKDGSYLQDFFASQLVRVCLDYGFDGWHGADGYGPFSPVHIMGFDDDIFGQFVERGQTDLPAEILVPTNDIPEKMTCRRDWIWQYRRLEWIEFYSDRWAEFWKVMVDALHGIGREAMINSAWTRDPFEALYRYGIDYQKIAATGVDSMMVETCAGGILLSSNERDYHYDYLAMLMHIKACVPDLKLIFLHNTKDVAEDWDLLRHAPAMLQREVYSLANVFHLQTGGKLTRCVDGFLACLADGISSEEWKWLSGQWELSFGDLPQKVHGVKLLWSDTALRNHFAVFPVRREASAHYLTYKLLEQNAPIQMTVAIAEMDLTQGPFLLLNPHHISEEEKQSILASKQCVIVVGPDLQGWPPSIVEIRDGEGDQAMRMRVYGGDPAIEIPEMEPGPGDEESEFPENPLSIVEPLRFRAELIFRPVSSAFFQAASELLRRVCAVFSVANQEPDNLVVLPPLKVGVMMTEIQDDILRVAVKNSASIYARPVVDLGRPIDSVKIRSGFPVTTVKAKDGKFNLVVPQCGIVVADIYMKTSDRESSVDEAIQKEEV